MKLPALVSGAILLAASLILLGTACQPEDAASNIGATAGQAFAPSAWNLEKRRAWAANLRAEGLDDRAAIAYEALLSESGLSENLVTGISITLAEMHLAKGRHDQALGAVLRAKLYDLPPARRRRADEIAIQCFESLGRSAAADRLLDRASRLGRDSNPASSESGVVLAEIGDEVITLSDLEGLIAMMPPSNAKQLEAPGAKFELLKSLVAQKVMVRKARKLGYDQDDKVQLALDMARREVLVKKVVAEEVRQRVQMKPEEVELYYRAHPEVFRTPSRAEVDHIFVATKEDADAARARLKAGEDFSALAKELSQDPGTAAKGGRIETALVEGQAHEVFVRPEDVFAQCRDLEPGAVAASDVVSAKGRHLIRLRSFNAGKAVPFEQCKEDVERILRSEREQRAMQRLLVESLTGADIKIHEDRLP
ncbi:MAG: peptidyl-prolyl cis-trans isomerase [Planctomycetota bacterium]